MLMESLSECLKSEQVLTVSVQIVSLVNISTAYSEKQLLWIVNPIAEGDAWHDRTFNPSSNISYS
jgi:hypothetical protein